MQVENSNRPRYVLAVPARLDPDGAGILKYISEQFDALELPEPILSAPAFDNTLKTANITDIVPKSVSAGVSAQTKPIKEEFTQLLQKALGKAHSINVSSMSIDFGLEKSQPGDQNHTEKVNFLKSIAPDLYRSGVKIRLPSRLPNASGLEATSIPAFIRDSMCGMFGIELNVHPHEMLNTPPLEHVAKYRFLMDSIAFVYEPEAGNFLVDKLLEPWFKALDEIYFEGDIVFKPLVSTWENLDDAVDGIAPITRIFQKN